jgi:hypothetical protein
MTLKQSQRKRGVILSDQGWQKLQAAIGESEHQENLGEKYTIQQLGGKIGLDPATISKVLNREKCVDRRTIERFFRVFDLKMEADDYHKQSPVVQLKYNNVNLVSTDFQKLSQTTTAAPSVRALKRTPAPESTQELSMDKGMGSVNFPGSPLALNSPFYIERSAIETLAYTAIENSSALLRIKSPEKWGKTSFVYRILSHARSRHYQTIRLNIQQAEVSILSDLDRFLRWICANVAAQLNLDPRLDDYWDSDLGSKICCTTYFQQFILPQVETALVLALDEIHHIFEFPLVAQDFLSMLRVWHEEGKHLSIWGKLRQVVVYATEVYIPLDLNQSPFNVGLPIGLPKLDLEQAKDLALRYGLNLFDEKFGISELTCAHTLVDGHPYLLHLALSHIAYHNVNVKQLFEQAPTPTGIYGDHLRRHLTTLQKHPELATAFKEVLKATDKAWIETVPAYKLESMGLVTLQGDDVTAGCDLYRLYFCNHLDQF